MVSYPKNYRDDYFVAAKKNIYRARSAYKLLEIDDLYQIFNGVRSVIDLCAAPGSWSQVAIDKIKLYENFSLISVDLQTIEHIEGAHILQGDISSEAVIKQIINLTNDNTKPELILCDGASDLTGIHEIDEQSQLILLESAIKCAYFTLAENGTLVCKLFIGDTLQIIQEMLALFFQEIHFYKPKSSRSNSLEYFVIAKQFYINNKYNFNDTNLQKLLI